MMPKTITTEDRIQEVSDFFMKGPKVFLEVGHNECEVSVKDKFVSLLVDERCRPVD